MDDKNQEKYTKKLKAWQNENKEFVAKHGDVLKRRYENEKLRVPTFDKLLKNVDKTVKSDIINTGGLSGAKKTPGWEDRHAEREYEAVRHRKTDASRIAKHTNFKESAVEEIRQHMFIKEHLFADGTVCRFDPSFVQVQAWDRLAQGKGTETDIMLLKHEYVELTQMKLYGYDYETAHEIVDKYHNWSKAICEEEI